MIDTDNHTIKDKTLEKIINDYCESHSSEGTCLEFSRVPFNCAYQIAIDSIELYVNYIQNKK